MSKYLTVSLLTLAFLLGFLFQAGAFDVIRGNLVDPSTAYPAVTGDLNYLYSIYSTKDDAAVYNRALETYLSDTISTTSISGFWQ